MIWPGKWDGQWFGQWFGQDDLAPGFGAGYALLRISAVGAITGEAPGSIAGVAAFQLTASATITYIGVPATATGGGTGRRAHWWGSSRPIPIPQPIPGQMAGVASIYVWANGRLAPATAEIFDFVGYDEATLLFAVGWE